MPVVLVPLSSHIFLQLWASNFTMQNLLLNVCVFICTCFKLETCEHVILIPLNDQPAKNTVAQYSPSSKCNWDNLCWCLLYVFTLYYNIQPAAQTYGENLLFPMNNMTNISRIMYVRQNLLMTINLCCINIDSFIIRAMRQIWWIYETRYVYVMVCARIHSEATVWSIILKYHTCSYNCHALYQVVLNS